MTELEAIRARHSVRRYTDRKIEGEPLEQLRREIDQCNEESGLHIQLILDEPEAFGSILAHYGMFKGVRNYIALVGRDEEPLYEKAGWYGERIVLRAQMLGLNTCWIAGTYSRKKIKVTVSEGERLVCVIALGYGANQGRPHHDKPMEKRYRVEGGETPDWFLRGMEAAMLAPTAVNQQKFLFTWNGTSVRAEATGNALSRLDLGIVKYHFALGAGNENFRWDAEE